MIKWLLPLLLGYTGGKMVYGHRGGVIGAVTTAAIAVATTSVTQSLFEPIKKKVQKQLFFVKSF